MTWSRCVDAGRTRTSIKASHPTQALMQATGRYPPGRGRFAFAKQTLPRISMRGEETAMNADEKAVAAVLAKYEKALNDSSTPEVMELYASDGVFMPQHSPSSVGTEAVRRAYDAVFNTIKLTVKFDLAEVRQLAASWVLARTNSVGKVRVHATGQEQPEANQELFVFQQIDGQWKIARYCFSTTNPPH
jgi:uncharacterized protein (TIGR02246 family)